MTIINVCNLFAPIVGPLIGIINILILILYYIYIQVLSLSSCCLQRTYSMHLLGAGLSYRLV